MIKLRKKISVLLFGISIVSFTNSVLAKTMQEIESEVEVSIDAATDAAISGDLAGVCANVKSVVLLWYEIDPRTIPPRAMQDYLSKELKIRTLIKKWIQLCGK